MADTLAAYYRASLEDYNRAHGLSDQSQTISNQRKVVTEFLHSSKELSRFRVLEFIDDGLTGTNTDRPQFQAMIKAAQQGQISCIVVKDLSRFGRNYLDVGDYLEHISASRAARNAASLPLSSRPHRPRAGRNSTPTKSVKRRCT